MGVWSVLLALAGAKDTVRFFRSQAEAHWIKNNQPEIWEKTAKYLLLSGYLTYRLTGKYVDSVASQVGYLPFDFKRHALGRPVGLEVASAAHQRAAVARPGSRRLALGVISAQAAQVTGIPEGLPLISAGADKACEVLASGCLTPDTGSLSYGTTATYNSTNTRYIEAIKHVPAYPAAMPDAYNTETIVQRGYWMVNWFKREFGLREQRIAAERGVRARDTVR